MALNMNSATDVHKYYGGSGKFIDRRKTWEDLGLGTAEEYQGTPAQNAQLVSSMTSNKGLTLAGGGGEAASAASSSSSAQPAAANYKSQSDYIASQLQALQTPLTPYNGDPAAIYQSYLDQKAALGPFKYEYANDPMYQQYAEQYGRAGRRAMEDTLAQVSARTGGLASSYAGAAAQQQYDRYMTDLNNVIPQLEQIAYGRYRDQLSDLASDYSTASALEGTQYGRYRDLVADQWNALQDVRSQEQWEYNNLAELIQTTGYTPTDVELRAAGMTRERANGLKQVYALMMQAASSGGSGGGGGGRRRSSGGGKDTPSTPTAADILAQVNSVIPNSGKLRVINAAVDNGYITADEAVEIVEAAGVKTAVDTTKRKQNSYGGGVGNKIQAQ